MFRFWVSLLITACMMPLGCKRADPIDATVHERASAPAPDLPIGDTAQPPRNDPAIHTELVAPKVEGSVAEELLLELYVTNTTSNRISRRRLAQVFSSPGAYINIQNKGDGRSIRLSPGAPYGYRQWYQPEVTELRWYDFLLGPKERVLLFRGDLIDTVKDSLESASGSLQHVPGDEAQRRANLEFQVRFLSDFMKGGRYGISMDAYSRSNEIEVELSPPPHLDTAATRP